MYSTYAFAKTSPEAKFQKINIRRNVAGDDDVTFKLKYCGICHSDVHIAENGLGMTKYPCVPGHELAGVVTSVGKNVTKVKPGDKVGVGCLVDSCGGCLMCKGGDEQFCQKGSVQTYNGQWKKYGRVKTDTDWTFGGYSGHHTVPERFIVKVPEGYPLESAGPVFCAGVTMFCPLSNWGADKGGKRVGIVGIGGLGQMGVQLAKAMGNTVTAISTSPNKKEAAMEIGADNFVVSTSKESMAASAGSLDLILNTVSAEFDVNLYLSLLAPKGVIVLIGGNIKPHAVNQVGLMYKNHAIAGSIIGGLPDTQRVIDFCHQHKIVPKIQMITSNDLDRVYEELNKKNDTILRNVLDLEASLAG